MNQQRSSDYQSPSIPSWSDKVWDQAKCIDAPEEIFFPPKVGANQLNATRMFYCRTCQISELCIEAAIDIEHGIFAGTGPQERERLRKLRDSGKEWHDVWRLMLEETAKHGGNGGCWL